MGPPALVDPVTRAAGIAVPPNQGSSSSLLEAVAAPLAQEVPVMRGLDTADALILPIRQGLFSRDSCRTAWERHGAGMQLLLGVVNGMWQGIPPTPAVIKKRISDPLWDSGLG